MMKWNHLPVDGGIYDQHPKFLDDVLILYSEDNKAQQEAHERQQRKTKKPRK